MFTPNRQDKLFERQKTRYTWIPFQVYIINQSHRIVLYFDTIWRCLCSCARLRHTWVSCQNIFKMVFNVRSSFVRFQVQDKSKLHFKVLQSPSQDSILYYKQSDLCASVCNLGTLGSLVRVFHTKWLQNASQWSKMWGNCWWFLFHPKDILFYERGFGGWGGGDVG